MKKTFALKPLALSVAVAAASAASIVPATVQAGVSANIGMVSGYVFRGVEQTETASASAGLDFESDAGFYIGTWAADVEDGLEYDIYAGWSGEFEGVSLGLGATGYYYTDDWDEPYEEVNLSVGYDMFSVGYDIGKYDGDIDYDHMSVGVGIEDFSITLGQYDPDTDTDDDAKTYLDLGYGTELSPGLDGSINLIGVDSEGDVDDTYYLILGVSKSFDLM